MYRPRTIESLFNSWVQKLWKWAKSRLDILEMVGGLTGGAGQRVKGQTRRTNGLGVEDLIDSRAVSREDGGCEKKKKEGFKKAEFSSKLKKKGP